MSGDKHDALGELELVTRARRGELAPADQRALGQALERSALLQVAHATGQAFDAAGVVRAGDEALILRAATAALEAPRVQRRRGGARLALGVAAALLVGSAAAAAIVVVREHRALELGQRPASMLPKGPTPTTKRSAVLDRTPAGPPASAPSAGVIRIEPSTERALDERPASAASPKPSAAAASAAELFRDASAARRAGDFGAARALYAELQARYPGTNEARVSQVSLGKLLLGAGKPREAERAFHAYLKSGGGDLGEEALVGRASALQALGDGGEERRAWQELVRNYPASVYRARAEARSKALDAARDPASE